MGKLCPEYHCPNSWKLCCWAVFCKLHHAVTLHLLSIKLSPGAPRPLPPPGFMHRGFYLIANCSQRLLLAGMLEISLTDLWSSLKGGNCHDAPPGASVWSPYLDFGNVRPQNYYYDDGIPGLKVFLFFFRTSGEAILGTLHHFWWDSNFFSGARRGRDVAIALWKAVMLHWILDYVGCFTGSYMACIGLASLLHTSVLHVLCRSLENIGSSPLC